MASFRFGFLMFFCTFAVATLGATVQANSPTFTAAFRELAKITTMVEEIFDEFIKHNMECTDLSQCREELTSLRLIALPQPFPLKMHEDFEHTWVGNFEMQLQGMQIYSKILNAVVEIPHRSFNGRSAKSDIVKESLQRIGTANTLLKSFIHSLRDNVSRAHCVDLSLPLAEEAICEICSQPSLPSRPLEIVRNYQFLLQMRDYFEHFKGTLMYLIVRTPRVHC